MLLLPWSDAWCSVHVLLLACLALATGGFIAGLFAPADPEREDLAYVGIGGGRFDLLDSDEQQTAADLRAEWRGETRLAAAGIAHLHPFVALEASDDDAYFGFAGVLADLRYGRWYMAPSLGAGAYDRGEGRDLGRGLQFRSQFELGHVFAGGQRLGAALSHLSNAGLAEHNPGVEVFSVYYWHPLP